MDGGDTTDTGTRDSGRDTGMMGDGGGDPCDGLTLCTTEGVTCNGDDLVDCAMNADGCLVETTTDCTDTDEVCDDTSGTAACVDPCSLIPVADRCTTEGRSCGAADESLTVCAMDADGCLVQTVTDCAASPGGVCDTSGAMPMCVLPPDPCAGIAGACTTAGFTCSGEELVECAPNAFGCLVETRTDCTDRAGGTCDETAAPPACTFTGDPCAGITQCTGPAEATCDGPTLVTCEADGFGCMVETRTDCTSAMFGFCDETATGPDACSTAATDPCMGMTECGTTTTRTCSDADTIGVCSPNAFGCFVTSSMDCAGTDVCDTSSGTAMCVDPCSLVTECATATSCAGNELVTCTPDSNGCLVESSRMACAAPTMCTTMAGTSSCADTVCPGSSPMVLDCGDTFMGTTTGGTRLFTTYGSCYTPTGDYDDSTEQVVRFRNDSAVRQAVRIVSAGGPGDYDLFVMDGGDGTTSCASASTCLDGSRGGTTAETVDFVGEPGQVEYVIYDYWGGTPTTTDYTLTVTCTPIVCGNGTVELSETCDDGNTASGDGCSSSCAVEPAYTCTGTPSMCTFQCGNGVINAAAGETCDDGNTTAADGCSAICQTEAGFTCFGTGAGSCRMTAANATCAGAIPLTGPRTGDDVRAGGPRPTGTGCGTSPGPVRYYSVTVPAATEITVTGTPTATAWDLTLRSLADCASGNCLAAVDANVAGTGSAAAESIRLPNAGGTATTFLVAVGADSTTTAGTYDLAITSRPLAPNATCTGALALTGTLTGDLAGGGPRPTGTGCGSGAGPVLYYSVTIPAASYATVTGTPTTTFDMYMRSLADCSGTCTGTADARGSGTGAAFAETVRLVNTSASPITQLVAVGSFSATTFGTFSVTVTTASLAANATCSGAVDLTATITGENLDTGGPRPTGTGCGTSAGPVRYYRVTIPAVSEGTIVGTPTGATAWDLTLRSQTDCAATSCLAALDAGGNGTAETMRIANNLGVPVTRIIAVGADSATTWGTYDIAFTSAPLPYLPIIAMCVDASAGTAVPGVTGDDATSATIALPFSFTFFGIPQSHYSVATNGFLQLWPAVVGMPTATPFTNSTTLPNTATPNSFVAPFWDDLSVTGGASVRTVVTGTAPNRVFTVEWNNVQVLSTGETVRFQAQLFEMTNVIELHYCAASGTAPATLGSSATIGIENSSGTAGTRVSINSPDAATPGTGYRITP